MPRRPSLEVSDTAKGFLVHVPASLAATGKMERRYFKDRKDADALAGRLRTMYHKGIRGGVVGPVAAHQAEESEKLLKGTGLSLLEAVRAFSESWHRLTPLGATIGCTRVAFASCSDWWKT